MTRIEPGGRAVLFAFDDQSIPWRYRLRLEMHRPEKYDGNPVIARGPMQARSTSAAPRTARSCTTASDSGCGTSPATTAPPRPRPVSASATKHREEAATASAK